MKRTYDVTLICTKTLRVTVEDDMLTRPDEYPAEAAEEIAGQEFWSSRRPEWVEERDSDMDTDSVVEVRTAEAA